MLPNHSPLVIAEQFGTLESLYPDRIDLGLGRAPGTDQSPLRALRRDWPQRRGLFPQRRAGVAWRISNLPHRGSGSRGAGRRAKHSVWLLGSSLFGAQLAAYLGLPYAFASHFAPGDMVDALSVYRATFQPSAQLDRPYAMLTVNVYAADTDAEARRHFTSLQQAFINLRRGTPGKVPPPVDDIESYGSPEERAGLAHALSCSFVGSATTVETGLRIPRSPQSRRTHDRGSFP